MTELYNFTSQRGENGGLEQFEALTVIVYER